MQLTCDIYHICATSFFFFFLLIKYLSSDIHSRMEMDTKPTEDMLRDTLYLESSGDTSHVTLPSLIVIFLQQYCHYHNLDVILVCGSEKKEAKDSSKAPLKSHLELDHERGVELKDTNISTSDDNLDSNSIRSDAVGLNLLEIPKSIEYRVLKHVCLPRVVQDCQLPCILLPGRQLCVSGLANVLRHIIQAAVPLEPHRNLETLLVSESLESAFVTLMLKPSKML